ncbi:hypothetical protein V8G54_018479 [Vigna mungo]|uniref:S-acyltransferase n=1 Tax=Vigna mungo TaxID=3915 RepID=A0AAQ3RU09_VIGMU
MQDLIFLFITHVRDPGIRNSRPLEFDNTFDIPTSSIESINLTIPHLKPAPTKDVVVNGHIEKVEFCDTCLLYSPPGTTHCSICNDCIEGYDHHCGCVGRCIGRVSPLYYNK